MLLAIVDGNCRHSYAIIQKAPPTVETESASISLVARSLHWLCYTSPLPLK